MLESSGPKGPKIIAIANQKGGVGKTTTAINLGACLARRGRETLVVDLDPQGNASTGLGIDVAQRQVTTYDLLHGGVAAADALLQTGVEHLSIIPATTDLSSTDLDLGSHENRATLLRTALRAPSLSRFSYILIDCPPSLSLLTVNAMVAAHSVFVPLQAEFFALEGLSQLMLTLREVRESANPDLRIEGIALTMSDARNRLSQQVEADARETLGELVFNTVVPRNVRLSEAPSFAMPIMDYDPTSKGALSYAALADELIAKEVV